MLFGKDTYESTCIDCHGEVPSNGDTIWKGEVAKAVGIDLFDSEQNGYKKRGSDGGGQATNLSAAEFIAQWMPKEAEAVGTERGEAITAYLTDKVGKPWCPGDAWPPTKGGGSTQPELVLEGPAPEVSEVYGNQFNLLPANAMHSVFNRENNGRMFIHPLRDHNWPASFDWKNASGDEELNEKHLWARAQLKSPLKTWYYDVGFDICGEGDGESPFAIAINGELYAEVAPPPAAGGGGVTCRRGIETVKRVPIRSTDIVQIWGKTHSNLKVREGANGRRYRPTHAWARARWYGVIFTPSEDAQ